MIATKFSPNLRLVLLCVMLFPYPACAQDWFLPRTEQLMPVQHVDRGECAALLKTMVPDVSIEVWGSGLKVKGKAEALEDVRLLLHELDRPLDSILVDVRLLVWEKSCATEIRTAGEWSGDGLSMTEIWPPCSGDSLVQLRFLEAQGRLRWLASERIETRLGKPVELELEAIELELALDLEVSLGANNGIETEIRVSAEADGLPEYHISRILSDGFPFVVTGFADHQLLRLEESEEFVLVLVPHLMR